MSRMPDPQVRERWMRRLRRFRDCDATVSEFCRREGVSVASYYHWRRKLAEAVEDRSTERPHFVPVAVTGTEATRQASDAIELALPGGAVLKLPACADRQVLFNAIAATVQATGEGQMHEVLSSC